MRTELAKTSSTLDHAARAFRLLAELTAAETDTRVLLLSQDSLELRATGGYVGSYGVIRFSHGSIALERYEEVAALPPPDPPVQPPAALEGHLPTYFSLSNVNWWPDFPTTAYAAREMFRRQGGGEVDAVLALTELATARIIGAIGALKLPSYAEPVVERGFDQRVLYEVETKQPHDEPRKKFLIELSNTLFEKVFHLPAAQLPPLADAIGRSVSAGDIQLWFAGPERQRELRGSTITGALPQSRSGDFLMLVDTNVQASKANLGLVRDVAYEVRRRHTRISARLEVRLKNEGPELESNRVYRGFLRVYVPRGSRLRGHPPGQGTAGPADDGPYDVFVQGFQVPHGEARSATFVYDLPRTVAPRQVYTLTWMRQAGTPADRLSATAFGAHRAASAEGRLLTLRRDLDSGFRAWLRRRWLAKKLGLFV